MSNAIAHDVTAPLLGGRSHFLLRRLHSLTGLVFGGYLVVHLIVNATIAQMGTEMKATIYQLQVDKIHSLPLLIALEWGAIFLPIIFHTIYGTWIIFTGQPNVISYPYRKNWYYLLQRISAGVILFFMLFHVLALKYGLLGTELSFDPHEATTTIHRHMVAHWWIAYLVYPIGIVASCYHLANGFWTAAITWGLTVSAGAQRRFGYVCAAIFVATLGLGLTALIASVNVNPAAITTTITQ